MKNKFSCTYYYLIIIILLFILLIILKQLNFKQKNLNEFLIDKFENKVNLSCDKSSDNKYNCKSFQSKTIIKNINYPQLVYETGISPLNYKGEIKFKKKFKEIPTVYTQSIYKTSDDIDINTDVTIYDISMNGFKYKKTIMIPDSETGLLTMDEDKKSKFNWLALTKPANPIES